MILGLIQFRRSQGLLGDCGINRGDARPLVPTERLCVAVCLAVLLLVVGLGVVGMAPEAVSLSRLMTYIILGIAVLFFGRTLFFGDLDRNERERVGVILMLFLASAVFWAGFEQAGSSFNLFAERYTDRWIACFRYDVPAEWFQTLGPVFVISLAPLFATLWVALARAGREPSIPVKFGLALILLASGFVVMSAASRGLSLGGKVWPTWLITTYLLHTFGELCLSPVGLSAVTKLSPRRLVGQMMGIWFLATSLGNLLAGLLAGKFNPASISNWPLLYLKTAFLPLTAGILLLLLARPIGRLAGGSVEKE
jgi:POT family proton-dependent oligopeptide transporter